MRTKHVTPLRDLGSGKRGTQIWAACQGWGGDNAPPALSLCLLGPRAVSEKVKGMEWSVRWGRRDLSFSLGTCTARAVRGSVLGKG